LEKEKEGFFILYFLFLPLILYFIGKGKKTQRRKKNNEKTN
jgi:hypothetical protein